MEKIIIASGPVIVEDNKTLLDKQGADNFWKFCGGRAKDGETLMENAARRAKEELGIEIEIIEEKPYIIHTTKKTPAGNADVILVHYLAKRIGEIKPGSEVQAWDWIDCRNLPGDIGPNVIPALKHFGFI